MSDHDLLLGDTITAIVADDSEVLVQLVADGIMWRGTPVTGASWARSLPCRDGRRPPLRDRLAVSGYLHLDRASYRLGERWAPAGRVRLRLDSVSAWWLRGVAEHAPAEERVGRA
ncbi:hypothetical protein [Streptacidiphilus jiangxiensis]|uniref:Uncharacterized protein n=1 Tax=Streptacidiphilus jiangxiensis TaxID=235985 RepID=A0A1H7ZBR5_STRJI|nr:hypothetical protein [Streptacidiphilus jiangxiensis]SEM55671.1 hypothetical protein SAMN05414137_1349 [Streptacidiphilus jiangxiensis]